MNWRTDPFTFNSLWWCHELFFHFYFFIDRRYSSSSSNASCCYVQMLHKMFFPHTHTEFRGDSDEDHQWFSTPQKPLRRLRSAPYNFTFIQWRPSQKIRIKKPEKIITVLHCSVTHSVSEQSTFWNNFCTPSTQKRVRGISIMRYDIKV